MGKVIELNTNYSIVKSCYQFDLFAEKGRIFRQWAKSPLEVAARHEKYNVNNCWNIKLLKKFYESFAFKVAFAFNPIRLFHLGSNIPL
jgi:hypothetical protein